MSNISFLINIELSSLIWNFGFPLQKSLILILIQPCSGPHFLISLSSTYSFKYIMNIKIHILDLSTSHFQTILRFKYSLKKICPHPHDHSKHASWNATHKRISCTRRSEVLWVYKVSNRCTRLLCKKRRISLWLKLLPLNRHACARRE